jgi:hypothetical protein
VAFCCRTFSKNVDVSKLVLVVVMNAGPFGAAATLHLLASWPESERTWTESHLTAILEVKNQRTLNPNEVMAVGMPVFRERSPCGNSDKIGRGSFCWIPI